MKECHDLQIRKDGNLNCVKLIFRQLTLFLGLLLLLFLSSSGTSTSSTANSGRGGSTTTRADVQEEIFDVLALESLRVVSHIVRGIFELLLDERDLVYLGEERSPDWFEVSDSCGLYQSAYFVGLRSVSEAKSSDVDLINIQ